MPDIRKTEDDGLPAAAASFYADALRLLDESDVRFLVGGAFAFERYTGIHRRTKDFDLFLCEADLPAALAAFDGVGYETDVTFPHWLAKVHHEGESIDLIFRSGNGVAQVDDAWFARAPTAEVLGRDAQLCPVEETIWTKAFIMERERFDGADVAHLLRSHGADLDWRRLVGLFKDDWRVLLAHVILFGFIYPMHREAVPAAVTDALLERLREQRSTTYDGPNECRGTLLSRAQYLVDVEEWGYLDARVWPRGGMTQHEVLRWTDAIEEE